MTLLPPISVSTGRLTPASNTKLNTSLVSSSVERFMVTGRVEETKKSCPFTQSLFAPLLSPLTPQLYVSSVASPVNDKSESITPVTIVKSGSD